MVLDVVDVCVCGSGCDGESARPARLSNSVEAVDKPGEIQSLCARAARASLMKFG